MFTQQSAKAQHYISDDLLSDLLSDDLLQCLLSTKYVVGCIAVVKLLMPICIDVMFIIYIVAIASYF